MGGQTKQEQPRPGVLVSVGSTTTCISSCMYRDKGGLMAPEDSKVSNVSRRGFLQRAAAVGLGSIAARGVYEVLDDFVTPPRAWAATVSRKQEQYLIDSLEVILDNNTPVIIPPIYNDVFTAKLAAGKTWNKTALVNAQKRLEAALVKVESPYSSTAAGVTIVVAWGLPYFETYVNGPWQAKGPRDLDPNLPRRADGQRQFAVVDAIRFPSDPGSVVLEANHVAFKIRSDKQSIVQSIETKLFVDPNSGAYVGDLFDLTSKRIGFLGRGFGTRSIAKQMAMAAKLEGADQIPDKAQLMLGFTSTQTAALGPDNIPSFETLPNVTNQWPSGYFAAGCAMHLSHLYEDIKAWYSGFNYSQRVARMFSPRMSATDPATVTLPNGPANVSTKDELMQDAGTGLLGHNATLQRATRLAANVTDNYRRVRSVGTAVPLREDFNTIDDPFFWSPTTGVVSSHAAGMHFVAFVPASSKFHAARMAMDGVLPDGTDLTGTVDPKYSNGINSVIQASHRQNYLIPPRRHRSFPLVELLK
jgi:hypothetical protein